MDSDQSPNAPAPSADPQGLVPSLLPCMLPHHGSSMLRHRSVTVCAFDPTRIRTFGGSPAACHPHLLRFATVSTVPYAAGDARICTFLLSTAPAHANASVRGCSVKKGARTIAPVVLMQKRAPPTPYFPAYAPWVLVSDRPWYQRNLSDPPEPKHSLGRDDSTDHRCFQATCDCQPTSSWTVPRTTMGSLSHRRPSGCRWVPYPDPSPSPHTVSPAQQ